MPELNDPAIWLKELFLEAGLTYNSSSLLSTIALILIVGLLSWLSNTVAKIIINRFVSLISVRTTAVWSHVFSGRKVFSRLSHLAPATVIWLMADWALQAYPTWLVIVQKLANVYIIVTGTIVVNSFIEAWHKIYITLPISQNRHLKGYVQLLKILVIIISALIVVSVVFRKDMSTIIAGLSAMAAVLLFVFKDILLGLVASIQLSADDMLKVGDWITIQGRNVDGVVTDITLNTVKVQNFDKTIITVPTYSLVNESFQNWRGMEESGVRQIKRAMYIDIKSIKFISSALREKLSAIPALKEYMDLEEKHNVLTDNEYSGENVMFYNFSKLTNLGIFRHYIETYLRQNPLIELGQTVLVRHRDPGEFGLPLQVYVYVKNNQFVPFENLQSEIFEHFYAILNEFELKIFQQSR